MRERIDSLLTEIEQKYAVKILYACESGSRAWGFASPDSDYDVRFLYLHPTNWYLSISDRRDVIEYINDGVLDINGWDLRKALSLLWKSNAPLREWLSSPIVYRVDEVAFAPIKVLAEKHLLPEPMCHHYLGMAQKGLLSLQEGAGVKLKTYLYMLRPLLCCRWILTSQTQPPMLIDDLLAGCFPDQTDALYQFGQTLIAAKKRGGEAVCTDRNPEFETEIAAQIAELKTRIPKNRQRPPIEPFDQVFRQLLQECFAPS